MIIKILSPRTLTEEYEINELSTDMKVDFIAVKVGDVDNSVMTSAENEGDITSRSNAANIEIQDLQFEEGEQMIVPFTLSEIEANGYQFTLNYNSDKLEILNITKSD